MFNPQSRNIWILGAVMSVAWMGCTRSQDQLGDPEKSLKGYISKSFSVAGVADRQELVSFLTGEAKTRLTSWSDEQFKQAFIETKKQFINLVFQEVKKISAEQVNITYELVYLDQGKGVDAKVTNKKLCTLMLNDGKWLISDVRNINELIEYRNEMSLP